MKWIKVSERLPLNGTEVLMYREDAGVFTGFYGNIAENMPDAYVEGLSDNGVEEEILWECIFWSCDMNGLERMELDMTPEYWAELPEFIKPA